MRGFVANIENLAKDNDHFIQILYTGGHLQLAVICLQAGGAINDAVHADHDRFFCFESGGGKIRIDGEVAPIGKNEAFLVPAGAHYAIVKSLI